MQGERLYFPFVIRVPFVFGVFVLNDPRRSAEVVKHIFVNLPHLNRVDGEGLAINLFYICEFLIVDNHSALIVRGRLSSVKRSRSFFMSSGESMLAIRARNRIEAEF